MMWMDDILCIPGHAAWHPKIANLPIWRPRKRSALSPSKEVFARNLATLPPIGADVRADKRIDVAS